MLIETIKHRSIKKKSKSEYKKNFFEINEKHLLQNNRERNKKYKDFRLETKWI